MSEFLGHMREYKQLSIDRFDGYNLRSTAFFLSHCHKDHMTGLDSPGFIGHLRSRTGVFLYCTEISKVLLLSESVYRPLEKYIKILTPEMAERISLPDLESCKSTDVLVTPLPALHCPGSVMFLFEGDEGTVLYTGDFRWETNHAINISAFKTGESLKEIDSMYIDTTFCVESAFRFPSRMECCEVSCNIINDWLSRSNQHYVHITSRTKYGHEPLMRAIHDSTGHKIHVPEWKFDVYSQISELSDVFTTSPSTRIHACDRVNDRTSGSKLPCGFLLKDDQQIKVRSIRPSTMFFTMGHENIESHDLYVPGRSLHRVCYSFHSSYSEIRDVVMYLKPKRIVPNVKPFPDKEIRQVQQRLNKFLKLPHRLHMLVPPSTNLGNLKHRKTLKSLKNQDLPNSEELVFDSQSPMKTKKIGFSESHLLKTPEKPQDDNAIDMTTPTRTDSSQVSSSYEPSIFSGEEMSLTESDDQEDDLEAEEGDDTQQSLRLYVSGDDEVSEDERVSSLEFKESFQEESFKTEKTSETIQDKEKLENKANGMKPEKDNVKNQGDVGRELDVDEDRSEKNDKKSDTSFLKIDRSHDDNENNVRDLTIKNKNNAEDLLDQSQHSAEEVSTVDGKSKNDNENSVKDVFAIDCKGEEYNQNRKESQDGIKGEDVSYVDVQCKGNESLQDVASPSKDNTTTFQHIICDEHKVDDIGEPNESRKESLGGNEDTDRRCSEESEDVSPSKDKTTLQTSVCDEHETEARRQAGHNIVQTRHSETSSDDNTKAAVNLLSSCNSQNRRKSLSERSYSFDLFEDNNECKVEASQGFDPECLSTDNPSDDDISSKTGDSQVCYGCSVGDGDGINLKARNHEGFNSVEHGDGVQFQPCLLKVDSECVLTGDHDRSSLDQVGHSETKTNKCKDSSERSFKTVEHTQSPSETEGQHEEDPSKIEDHEGSSKSGKYSETDAVSSDISMKNKVSTDENVFDNHFKKNSLNLQSQFVCDNQSVHLLPSVLDTSNQDFFSEESLCSSQLLNTDVKLLKDKKQLSVKESCEEKLIKGDGHRHNENKDCSNSNSSSIDDQASKLTSCLSERQTSVSCMEEDDESDVVIIDLSDSDSQEPPFKRWKGSPMPKVDGFSGQASTSRNRSVLDHLDHLRNVLDNGQESDSDNTLPLSQNLLYGSGFYSDSDSEVQIISDDDDDSRHCYSHHSEDFSSSGWHTARVGDNRFRAASNSTSIEDECIDLTLDDD